MARTKQTARREVGGKAPRKSHASKVNIRKKALKNIMEDESKSAAPIEDASLMTVPELKKYLKENNIAIPPKGSGAKGNVIKKDLVVLAANIPSFSKSPKKELSPKKTPIKVKKPKKGDDVTNKRKFDKFLHEKVINKPTKKNETKIQKNRNKKATKIMTQKNITFTGLPETDKIILSNLSFQSLINACSTNVYVRELCDDNFWKNKLKIDFGHTKNLQSPKKYYVSLNKKRESSKRSLTYIKDGMKKILGCSIDRFVRVVVHYQKLPKSSGKLFIQKLGAVKFYLDTKKKQSQFSTDTPRIILKSLQFLAKKQKQEFTTNNLVITANSFHYYFEELQ